MIFSSVNFYLFFLPLCLLGYALITRLGPRWVTLYLALVSIFFYSRWSKRYTALLLGSMLFNFAFSKLITAARKRPHLQSAWLTLGIVANLGALCYFKYLFPILGFLTEHGWSHRDWGSVVLPLGISFFTFTQIAYLIDLKQGIAQPETISRFALFVTFFPHLIAGPILHHKEMMPQFRVKRDGLNAQDMAVGLTWFTMGFFKKTVIADRIAFIPDALFANPHAAGAFQSWQGSLVYAMQLYFDFSGYSDMAVGLARMFSIRFPMNFNSPYKAENVIEFWQRWHMTLTRYIMDYVYAPIQMRVSRWRMDRGKKVSRKAQATLEGMVQMIAFPTIVTIFLAGIWHGAGLQFLVYGLMHGIYMTLCHVWRLRVPETSAVRRAMTPPVAVVITFLAVVSTFIMFRASSVHNALSVYAGMFGRHGAGVFSISAIFQLVPLFAVVWLMPNTQEILGESLKEDGSSWSLLPALRWRPTFAWWLMTVVALFFCVVFSEAGSTFLYFQF